jgi:hypothetical protein
VPRNPFGRYLNISAEVAEVPGGIRIQSLLLGSLPVPGAVADALARLAHSWLRRDEPMPPGRRILAGISTRTRPLDYHWRPELLARLNAKRRTANRAGNQARVLAYEQLMPCCATARQHRTLVKSRRCFALRRRGR